LSCPCSVPLISAYALRDEGAWYVFVLSRKLDGHDFGDGTTPTTLHLPFEAPASTTLRRLAHPDGTPTDPRDNNREALNVTIVSDELDPAAFSPELVVEGGMPPGTVYLYVFDPDGPGDDDDSGTSDDADASDDDDPAGGETTPGGCGCAGGGGALGLLVLTVPGLRRRRPRARPSRRSRWCT